MQWFALLKKQKISMSIQNLETVKYGKWAIGNDMPFVLNITQIATLVPKLFEVIRIGQRFQAGI